MNEHSLFKLGIFGVIIAALCCFTPVLVGLLGLVGLSVLTGYLDYVLLPALIFFIGLTAYALWKRKACETRCKTREEHKAQEKEV